MSADCLFCKIADGQIPAKKIFENEDLLAFHDIRPAAPVHFLIIPKKHITTLADCETEHLEIVGKMMAAAPRLARELGCGYDSATGEGGFRTVINTGPGGGQEVYHLHVHVLGGPRPWRRAEL